MEDKIRIVVVDDHGIVRNGIINIIGADPQIEVVAEGNAGNHIFELLAEHHPHILITDLQMPEQSDPPKGLFFEPVSSLKRAIDLYPETMILVISQEHDIQTIQSLAEIGVKGYLLKSDDFDLVDAVKALYKGSYHFSKDVQQIIFSAPALKKKTGLTERQMEVIRMVVRNPTATREEQANSLHISLSTLQKHINAIFNIMKVPNMESCVIKAMRMGIISVESVMGK